MGDQPIMAPRMGESSTADREMDPRRLRNRNVKLDLARAAMEGDWGAAKKMIDENADLDPTSLRLNGRGMTALHIAASSGRTEFVVELVRILNDGELKQKDQIGRNVLHHVAVASDVAAAKAVVERLPRLVKKKEVYEYTPLFYAARWRHSSKGKEMLEYLFRETKDDAVYFETDTAPNLIVAVTAFGCHNVALDILKKNPKLAVATNKSGWSILYVLAGQPSAFDSGKKVSMWKNIFCPWMKLASEKQNDAVELVHFICKELRKKEDSFVMSYFMPKSEDPLPRSEAPSPDLNPDLKILCPDLNPEVLSPEASLSVPSTLHVATKNGVFKLVELCLKYFPDMIWYTSPRRKLLLHVAVKHRRVKLFNHLMELIGNKTGFYASMKVDDSDEGEINILHLAALLAPTPQLHSIAGPAFQLQRELEWFKAVEALVYKEQMDEQNSKHQKPIDSFYAKHNDLINDAKQWIKDTSNSCMVVAALVATVAFASMITVPGGNDSGTGKPVLSKKEVFIVFSISNALSMISSAIALLMFLSLQTSRFTTEDFLATLPKNLLRGLLALFFAVATMMIAFGTAIGMALQTRLKWAYIPIIVVACIPTIIFTKLQLPLLYQTLGAASGPTLFTKQRNLRKHSLLEDCRICLINHFSEAV